MLSTKRSTGVALEMNLRSQLHTGDEACRKGIHPGCETQGRSHQNCSANGLVKRLLSTKNKERLKHLWDKLLRYVDREKFKSLTWVCKRVVGQGDRRSFCDILSSKSSRDGCQNDDTDRQQTGICCFPCYHCSEIWRSNHLKHRVWRAHDSDWSENSFIMVVYEKVQNFLSVKAQ